MHSWLQCQGQTFVELALSITFFFLIVLGVIQGGWLVRSSLLLGNAAKDGARSLAQGNTTANVLTRMKTGVDPDIQTAMGVQFQKSSDGATWTTLSDSGSYNNASAGQYVRALVRYTNFHIPISQSSLSIREYTQ